MKNYMSEDSLAGTLHATPKTLREKVRGILQLLAKQSTILHTNLVEKQD